ncbi:MAG: hypothetical protein ACQEV7_18790, partial [Bacillota bacterium]
RNSFTNIAPLSSNVPISEGIFEMWLNRYAVEESKKIIRSCSTAELWWNGTKTINKSLFFQIGDFFYFNKLVL